MLKTKHAKALITFAGMSPLALQIAHDIRSPLAALEVVAKIGKLNADDRFLIETSVDRIRDLVSLLSQPSAEHTESKMGLYRIDHLTETLLKEKRAQYALNPDCIIESEVGPSGLPYSAHVHPIDFMRVLSNIIDNAVESLTGPGRIFVSIDANIHSKEVIIAVRDTGRGIPSDLLPKLMNPGATFGKPHGSGLGLYFARCCIEDWGGSIHIASKENEGTTVEIRLKS